MSGAIERFFNPKPHTTALERHQTMILERAEAERLRRHVQALAANDRLNSVALVTDRAQSHLNDLYSNATSAIMSNAAGVKHRAEQAGLNPAFLESLIHRQVAANSRIIATYEATAEWVIGSL